MSTRRIAQLVLDRHDEFIGLIEGAGNYLMQCRTAVRDVVESGDVNAETFDNISSLTLQGRRQPQALLDDLDRTPSPYPGPGSSRDHAWSAACADGRAVESGW
jgi:hypothetical protein